MIRYSSLHDPRGESTWFTLEFCNGPTVVDRSRPCFVRAVTRAEHGDWKTQLNRTDFMGLETGEIGEVVEVFSNFYGRWVRVQKLNGRTADVRENTLEVVSDETVNNEHEKKTATMRVLATQATHRVKHLKTGDIYFVICDVLNCTNANDGQNMTLYMPLDRSKVFCRETHEFNTRFQRI